MEKQTYVRPSDRPLSAAVKVGRFDVIIDLSRSGSVPHQVKVIGAAKESGEDVTFTISRTDPAFELVWKLNEIKAWSDHLDIEDAIAADPAKYEALAKKAIANEDAEREARETAQRKAAEATAKAAQAARERQQADAKARAEQAEQERQRQEVEAAKARLDAAVYEAAKASIQQ